MQRSRNAEPEKNGDVVIFSEYQLYTEPPRIDILIIVKKTDIEMKSSVCKFFRTYNIIEYKSPADSKLTIHDFDKTVHGYAGFYASKNEQRRTDMTATIICFKKPAELFKELENNFGYEILQKDSGIYYIVKKGTSVETSLAVQIVVTTELPDSELALGTIGVEFDGETAKKVLKFIEQNQGLWPKLGYWFDVQYSKNHEILYKEAKMTGRQMLFRDLVADGFFVDELRESREMGVLIGRQEGRLEGMQEGAQKVFALLENGMPLAEAKKICYAKPTATQFGTRRLK